MIKYILGDNVGALEPWPFDNPKSAYRIVSGNPYASGRLDAGGPGDTTRAGIWRCSRGVFECTEQGDELMTILSGRCQLTNKISGEVCVLRAGESLFVRDGTRLEWDIIEEVTKVFFGHKVDGY
ncbi:cupin domain-containing protein [Ruegeria arenilitoris]|uniref:cupin domain-containing protein n=1 Tax=Ruegeria arenilitoris TaxID=1173585 RepID=UPI00147DD1E9|nr:cupin domain-containing protein [Ruegeria arenilitoris]